MVANGATPALDTSGALPFGLLRLMAGAAPYSATGGTNWRGNQPGRLFPRQMAYSVLQPVTAPQELLMWTEC